LIFHIVILSLLTARFFFESLLKNVGMFNRVLLQPLFIYESRIVVINIWNIYLVRLWTTVL